MSADAFSHMVTAGNQVSTFCLSLESKGRHSQRNWDFHRLERAKITFCTARLGRIT